VTSNRELTCPRGHFLAEPLIDLATARWAERVKCRGCKADVYVYIAEGFVQVRATPYNGFTA
jgi:hypothetical protein